MDCKKGLLYDEIQKNGCLIFNYDNVKHTELSKIKKLMDKHKGKTVICPDINNVSFKNKKGL